MLSMKAWIIVGTLLATVCLATLLLPQNLPASEDSVESLVVGRIVRIYLVHLPPQHRTNKKLPVLLVFHGAGGTSNEMRGAGLDSWADRYGFVTVYPEAVGGNARRTWALGCRQCTWA